MLTRKPRPSESPNPKSAVAEPTIDISASSRSLHDTLCWRAFTLSIVAALGPSYRKGPRSHSLKIPCLMKRIKYGVGVYLSEAAALRMVAENTSIPVPKVYTAFQRHDVTYILMEFIEGEPIGKGWEERPMAERESFLRELRGYFEQLRTIPHPRTGSIMAADMQSLYDHRIWQGELGFGPFRDEADFNLFLRNGVCKESDILIPTKSDIPEDDRKLMTKLVDVHAEKSHEIYFTHGDASSSNILVRNGKVAALIDFEMSGFFPEYWEYTTAMNVNRGDGFWQAEIGKFLKPYPEEWEAEKIRLLFWGRKGYRGMA